MDNLTLAYLLILIGLALLIVDIFVPSFGILTVLALAAFLVAITLAFGVSSTAGFGTLVFVLIALPILGVAWYYTIGKRLSLQAPPADETLAHSPVHLELEQLRGRYGRTISALRPSGTTEFDGRRIDTLSEGNLIEPGKWVQCIDVRAGRVIVREVTAPPDLANMDTQHLL